MTAAAVRPRRPLDALRKQHDEAVKTRPFSHFAIFLAITAIFAYLAYHIGIAKHEPLIAIVPCVLTGFAARDAWATYKVWKSRSGGDDEKKGLRDFFPIPPDDDSPPTRAAVLSPGTPCCPIQHLMEKRGVK